MWVTLAAAVPPTIAAMAAWWRGPRGLSSMDAKLDDLLAWQVDHEREHIRMSRPRRGEAS